MNFVVGVSPDVYNYLMKQFDSGAQFAYSGKKDGTNRKLTRKDGKIYVAEPGDDRLVIAVPYANSAVMANMIPLSAHGENAKQTGGVNWVYDNKGNLIGTRKPDGSVLRTV